jgi:hypothetical protein
MARDIDLVFRLFVGADGRPLQQASPSSRAPGAWYLSASSREGYVEEIEPVKISNAAAAELAGVFDRALAQNGRLAGRASGLVAEVNADLRRRLVERLENARRTAAAIPDLERELEQFDAAADGVALEVRDA